MLWAWPIVARARSYTKPAGVTKQQTDLGIPRGVGLSVPAGPAICPRCPWCPDLLGPPTLFGSPTPGQTPGVEGYWLKCPNSPWCGNCTGHQHLEKLNKHNSSQWPPQLPTSKLTPPLAACSRFGEPNHPQDKTIFGAHGLLRAITSAKCWGKSLRAWCPPQLL